MFRSFLQSISWMQWNISSVIFIGGIFLSIAIIGIIEEFIPIVNRKGFLPISTTPGDRLFISILYLIAVFLLWLLFFKLSMIIIPCIIATGGIILIFWKG